MTQEQEQELAVAARVIAMEAQRAGFETPEEYFSKLLKESQQSQQKLSELIREVRQQNGPAEERKISLAELIDHARDREAKQDKPRETPLQAMQRLGGIGSLSSGIRDLSSNPDHMEGFGR